MSFAVHSFVDTLCTGDISVEFQSAMVSKHRIRVDGSASAPALPGPRGAFVACQQGFIAFQITTKISAMIIRGRGSAQHKSHADFGSRASEKYPTPPLVGGGREVLRRDGGTGICGCGQGRNLQRRNERSITVT